MKKLLISLGAISSVVAISATAISCGKSETKKPANKLAEKNVILDLNDVILDLTEKDILFDAIPKFAQNLLNKVLINVFSARTKGINIALSNEKTDISGLADEVSKQAFNDIYHIPLIIKNSKETYKIILGDLLLELLGGKDAGLNPLGEILINHNYQTILDEITNAFTKGNQENGATDLGKIVLAISPLLDNEEKMKKFLDALKAILPHKLAISLKQSGITLGGLLDNVQNYLIKDFDKISEMQEKTFDEIADNATYRRIATSIFASRFSVFALEYGITKDTFDSMKDIYKTASGEEISKEKFLAIFSNEKIKKTLEDYITIPEQETSSFLLGQIFGSYIDLKRLNIPELEFGRGAGQLGENEQVLSAKIAILFAENGKDIVQLLALSSEEHLNNLFEQKASGILEKIGIAIHDSTIEKFSQNKLIAKTNINENIAITELTPNSDIPNFTKGEIGKITFTYDLKTGDITKVTKNLYKNAEDSELEETEVIVNISPEKLIKLSDIVKLSIISSAPVEKSTNAESVEKITVQTPDAYYNWKNAGLLGLFDILGLYAIPVVDGKYDLSSLTINNNNFSEDQTQALVKSFYEDLMNVLNVPGEAKTTQQLIEFSINVIDTLISEQKTDYNHFVLQTEFMKGTEDESLSKAILGQLLLKVAGSFGIKLL